MLATFVVWTAVGTVLGVRNGTVQVDTGENISFTIAFTAFMVVGALIVARHPDNALGWVFSAIGLLAASGAAAVEYARFGFLTSPGAPGALFAAWYASFWWWPAIILTLLYTLLLFPTGRLPSPRWRPLAWTAGLCTATVTVLTTLAPTLLLQDTPRVTIPNPIGITGIQDLEQSAIGTVAFGILLASVIAAALSLILRFRQAHGEERQQLKWVAYAGALVGVSLLLEEILDQSLPLVTFGLLISLLPISVGIAILRYRLYAIDRLISRTVTYALVTGLLAGLYIVGVLALGRLLAPVTEGNQLAVAGSTLAVAAAFGPLRRHVQGVVDRRFNRARYDAGVAVTGFRDRLRDAVDLDELSAELLAAVDSTVQPAAASLWLAPHGARP